MSTFQRLFLICIFAGLGLAAAAVIVRAPQILDVADTTTSSSDDRLARLKVTETDETPTPEARDLLTPTTPNWPQLLPVEEISVDEVQIAGGDPNRRTEELPKTSNVDSDSPRKLVIPNERTFVGPLPAPTPPPTPVAKPEPKAEGVERSPAPVVTAFRDEEVTEVREPTVAIAQVSAQPIRQLAEEPTIRVAQARAPIPAEGDGLIDINIPDTEIREVLQLLSKAGGLNILASPSVTGKVKATLTGVDVDTALGAILRSTGYVARREGNFVYVGTTQDFEAMDHAVDRVATRVYRPNYVTATELQTLITPMLTPTIGSISVSSAAEVGIASDSSNTGGDNFAGAEVVLVRDYVAVLSQIDQVFHEVDQRPLQVSIEAMILSVKIDDETSIGVDWELLRSNNNVRLIFGSPLDDLASINPASNSGLIFGYLDTNLGFFLDALEKVGETHVISQPRLMCLNKQRAEIHIGEERGYVSTTVTETSATQSVEFLEVGTQLRLRPFISSDGLIRLEVHPELSTGTVEVSDNFTLPNKTVTQVTTNVMVRDGSTLVIGGLLREDLQKETEQIPLLGSLPVVGPLFRSKTDKTTRDEIIVLITPRIVWEPQFNCEGEYADCEFHQQHAILADKMSPVSRNFYGRKYGRLAKAAWVAGDAKAALRYANFAIHFNPLDRETIRLRSEIIAESGLGDRNVHTHLKEGLLPWQHPVGSATLTDWVLDDIHGPHTHLGQEPAPVVDQGVTGPSRDLEILPRTPPPEVIVPQREVRERRLRRN